MKVHLGNGSVYLREWINVDLWESGACLASREPQRVEKWGTTEDNYYSKSQFKTGEPLDPDEFVCDVYGSWESLPFESDSVNEILSRQCFEHLSKREANWGLMEAWRVLKMGGILRIDVPDHEAAFAQYAMSYADSILLPDMQQELEQKTKFMLRHLMGSRKNDFAYHMGSWTKEKLIEYCAKRGFAFVSEEENIHFYPAFCLKFVKVPLNSNQQQEFQLKMWDAAWQYAGNPRGTPLSVPSEWRVLEVGPGDAKRAWPRANVYVDKDRSVLFQMAGPNGSQERCATGDICDIPFADKSFDFVLTSHVLEHCEDPLKAVSELARVAHSGCIICPSMGKEAIFDYHEDDHKWLIHQDHRGNLHFFQYDESHRKQVRNQGTQSIMHKLLRLGAPQFGPDGAFMRKWWMGAEPFYDCIQHWTKMPSVIVHSYHHDMNMSEKLVPNESH